MNNQTYLTMFCLRSMILILLLMPFDGFSQIRSSKFYLTPLLFNPASTGRFNKSYRLGLSFRNEINAQNKDFKQNALSFDTKMLTSKLPENDCLAFGIVGMSEVGVSEGIRNSYFLASIGYHKALDESGAHILGIGFQYSLNRKTVTKPDLTFENDLLALVNYGYSNLDVFQFQNINFSYHDFNAGLIFQGKMSESSFYAIGLSVHNLTKPDKNFNSGTFTLPHQFYAHASFEKEFSNNNKVYLSTIVGISNKAINDLNSGINYDVSIGKNKSVTAGAWFRKNQILGSSVIPNLGIAIRGIILNFSYDIYVSTPSRTRNTSEASFIFPFSKTRNHFLEKRFLLF
jgi:hypothetical protein